MAQQFAGADQGGPGGTQSGPLEQESAAGLLSRLVADVTALLRNEVALAKAELSDTARTFKAAMVALAIGAAVLLAGLLALLAAAILALAEVLAPWAAALIVGAMLAIIGFAMLQGARKKLQPSTFDMDRTRAAVRSDAEVVTRRM